MNINETMDIHFTFFPEASDVAEIYNGLVNFNSVHFADLDEKQVGVFIRDADGNIAGGLTGKILYTTLHINYLWVSDSIRSNGWGRTLLERVELEAKKVGVLRVCVDTYNFQAPDFYKKFGFSEIGRYADYPKKGFDKIFFQKNI
ncbi:MAG: GNAT family N-acetyltransferase [Cellvibrio sp.]